MPCFKGGVRKVQVFADHLVSTDPISDETLIQAISNGEVWALESLYQRYKVLTYSHCYRMVADHQVAQNLTQEAFMKIWQHASLYVPQAGTLRTWLFTIVQHQTIDYLRALQRRSRLQEVNWDTIDEEEQPTQPDIWIETWQSILSVQVHAALLRIPPEQRLVIELAYFQGSTHVEIAQRCHIPPGTVKARMRLGLLHLKQALAQMGVDEI